MSGNKGKERLDRESVQKTIGEKKGREEKKKRGGEGGKK